MSAKEIVLSNSIEWFGCSVGSRLPAGAARDHLQRFGEPRAAVFHPEAGTRYLVDRDDAIGTISTS